MSYTQLEYRTQDAIALIYHNRPEMRNAECSVLLDEMDMALQVATEDPDVRVKLAHLTEEFRAVREAGLASTIGRNRG